MPRKPFKIEGTSTCGAKFTVGKKSTLEEAKRLARLHHSCTGRWPRIFNGKVHIPY